MTYWAPVEMLLSKHNLSSKNEEAFLKCLPSFFFFILIPWYYPQNNSIPPILTMSFGHESVGIFWQSSFVPTPLPPAAFVFGYLMIAKPRESVLWGCLSSSSFVCVSFSSNARNFCRFCIQVLMNIPNPADICACKHASQLLLCKL